MALITLADLLFRFSALGLLLALVLFNWPRLTHFERLLAVAGRQYAPKLSGQGNNDFQISRGLLGISM